VVIGGLARDEALPLAKSLRPISHLNAVAGGDRSGDGAQTLWRLSPARTDLRWINGGAGEGPGG